MNNFRNDLVTLLPRLRRFALTVTGSVQDADDVLHAAVERALRHETSWRPGTRMDSWMFRIIRNLWVDELRAKRRRNVSLEGLDEIAGEDGRQVVEHQLDLDSTRRALLNLPEEQRSVLCLVVIEGLSYQQTAEALSIPIGTVMSRLSRARAAMVSRVSSEPLRIASANASIKT